MVISDAQQPGTVEQRFVIRPNRSLTWLQAGVFFGLCVLLSFGIGVAFFVRGLPLVLPFSGIEMLALGIALYLSMRDASRQEVVSIGAHRITVEFGCRRPETLFELSRAWVQVVLERPAGTWHPSRLTLRSHGREIEIGSFLTEDERQALGRELARCVTPRYVEPSAA